MRFFGLIPPFRAAAAWRPQPFKSNRTTLATYFDHQGVMQIAQPRELRPNFLYKNGVWVQDGWLREGKSENILNDIGIVGEALPETDDRLLQDIPAYSWENTGEGPSSLRVDGGAQVVLGSSDVVQTIYVKPVSGSSTITLVRPWYWGPQAVFDFDKVTSSLPGMFIHGPYNGWFRVGGWAIPSGAKPEERASLQCAGPFKFLVTCNQIEEPAVEVAGTEYYDGTSWIPYGQTRTAD